MAEPRDPSHPPSNPYPSLARARAGRFRDDQRPARLYLASAGLLGVALLASGLFLWRRSPGSATSASLESPGAPAVVSGPGGDGGAQQSPDADDSRALVVLSQPRVVACHDRGPKKTLPDDCDRLDALEQALSRAIESAAACVPQSIPNATIEYLADVSFSRHTLHISLPRDSRSVHDRKVVAACAAAVRGALPASSLDPLSHEHARYQISITATYRSRS
jgi:hypothetical protein